MVALLKYLKKMNKKSWLTIISLIYFFVSLALPLWTHYLNRNMEIFINGFPYFGPIITSFVFCVLGGGLLFLASKYSGSAKLKSLLVFGMVFSGLGVFYGILLIFITV
ncbi:membrane hypothetical protein [Nitrospina gracilis 3/211]|uniref:Uncharacterized protein n=1 Tax=Nitrospina gracilis (strain 3/211) TaxID=1266370 RepID=M1ZBT2_NITG3|nr:membrane hypothetical protein [Nitrospina gracilis 3/211]